MPNTDPILDIDHVQFRWPGKLGFGISVAELKIEVGQKILLLGESGSGKSTLLSLVCGTMLADAGTVSVAGTNLASFSGGQRDRFRAEQIGVIFQQFNLLPFGSVKDNILLPLRFAPERRKRVIDANSEAKRLCDALGLPAGLLSARAATLSVGQQQRVAVARALIGGPPLIIADEPTSSLDASSQANFLDLMFQQIEANGAALLMVSHDARLAHHFDQVIDMKDISTILRLAT